jgi:hypothetical protein
MAPSFDDQDVEHRLFDVLATWEPELAWSRRGATDGFLNELFATPLSQQLTAIMA